MTRFGGPSTSSRATFVQRAIRSARAAISRSSSSGAPQTRKRPMVGRGPGALPAIRAVGAEHRALDDRLDLAVQGERQRLVEHPGDRAGALERAHRPRRCGPQALRGRARRARPRRPAARAARGRRGRPTPDPRTPPRPGAAPRTAASSSRTRRPPAASARTSASTSAGSAAGDFDVHALLLSSRRARPDPRLRRRRRLPPVELPLPDVRGRSRRERRAVPDAVVDRDPRARTARGSSPTPRRTSASSSKRSPPRAPTACVPRPWPASC